ncbi:sulfite exporter TauE/SafE family protein [soil metagenome]
MDLFLILLLGAVIGAVLGGLGGGGAILTVPVLVYIVNQSAQDATTSSLVIVGLTAAVGVLSYLTAKRVRWGLGLTFGLVGFPATFLGSFLNHRVDENVLLLGFSGLMVIAALAMVGDTSRGRGPGATAASRPSASTPADGTEPPRASRGRATLVQPRADSDSPATARPAPMLVVAVALGVGLLTGFFGVGGGFVIVPALVLVLRIPIQQAVGTSLMIVALNSATSLVSRAGTAHFDWAVIVPFTLAAMLATLAGKRVADRLPAAQLKRGFAVLLLLVAGYTAWQSVTGLIHPASSSSSSSSSQSALVSG